MNVLFLDDEFWRWEALLKHFPDALWVKTAKQAIDCLDRFDFDVVCLDHDLGLENGNGMQVAEHIARKGKRYKYILIHSWNTPAASSMHEKIYRSGTAEYLMREFFKPEMVEQFAKIVKKGEDE